MLSYILQQVGAKMGLNPSVSTERAVILRFVNEAAVELYNMSDMAGCLDEQMFQVNCNQTIALPDSVGQIRAMRESFSHKAVQLSQMRPRYNEFNWQYEWRDWRIKGIHPLQTSIRNQSLLTFSVKAVESTPIVVNVSGPAEGSSMMFETVIMDSLTKSSVNAYNDVSSFTKTAVSQYDVILSDADGVQLSMLPSNKLEAKYQIVDISTAPWIPTGSNPILNFCEVLYKKALPWFQNDTDEFPAPGYDNIIVNKVLQLWYEEQGNTQLAIAYYQKATQTLAQIHEDANRGTDDVVSMVHHPHDRIVHRVGFGRDWWYGYRIQGR